jgi:hypothetical protein
VDLKTHREHTILTLTDSLSDIDLQRLSLAEFPFLMSRDPDLGERSFFGQDELGEEHRAVRAVEVG